MNEPSYSFPAGAQQMRLPVYVIVGVSRSGKTLLGRVLGSCANVEYFDEPWLPMMMTIAAGTGAIDRSLAVSLVRTYVYELLNDRILMRHANFRPTDLTSIWLQKPPEEIVWRLCGLKTRRDVRNHIQTNATALVITLTDTLPFAHIIEECFPDCRFIHVTNDGANVASETLSKHWFSDKELQAPTLGQLFRQHYVQRKGYFLNFWVKSGDERRFIRHSEFGRGLYYWRRVLEMSLPAVRRLEASAKLDTYYLPHVLARPSVEFGRAIRAAQLVPTSLTYRLIDDLSRLPPRRRILRFKSVRDSEWDAVRAISREYAIPTDNLDTRNQ